MTRFLPYYISKYQLYIFQLEEYDATRYLKAILSKGIYPPKNLRKDIKWTTKAKILAVLTFGIKLIIDLILCYLIYSYTQIEIPQLAIFFLIFFYLLEIVSFVFIIQAQDLITPFEKIAKKRIIKKAKKKLLEYPNLKIVGVTGSYGKTSMKETVATILSEKFKVVKTTGNNNTPIGISRTILNHLKDNTEIFVVEMGEYVKGDVKDICEITPPDFSIISGINEAHLERYKTMENAISTKFEIVENSKPNAVAILNEDDQLIRDNYKTYVSNEENLRFYSAKEGKESHTNFDYAAKDIQFSEEKINYNFDLLYKGESVGKVKTSILAPYIIGNITGAATLAKLLGMNDTEIRLGISKLKPVEHRLESSMNSNNILVIDDTYNGNSDGIKTGLDLLSKFKSRRKVYVTPGLVETGSLKAEIHTQIGKDLAKVADLVIMLKNSATPYIAEGLKESGFDTSKVIWYDYSKEMYAGLHKHLESGDVVLMQNDWSDNYS